MKLKELKMIDIQFLGLVNATLQAATLLFIAALGELKGKSLVFYK